MDFESEKFNIIRMKLQMSREDTDKLNCCNTVLEAFYNYQWKIKEMKEEESRDLEILYLELHQLSSMFLFITPLIFKLDFSFSSF